MPGEEMDCAHMEAGWRRRMGWGKTGTGVPLHEWILLLLAPHRTKRKIKFGSNSN
jgi:hypothetical protein